MKKTYIVTDIKWDIDNDDNYNEEAYENLPSEVEVTIDVEEEELDDEDAEYAISEYLSDKYGFCHDGFSCQLKTE